MGTGKHRERHLRLVTDDDTHTKDTEVVGCLNCARLEAEISRLRSIAIEVQAWITELLHRPR